MSAQKIFCFSAQDFKEFMIARDWHNNSLPSSVACIEILCTPDVVEHYGSDFGLADKAWFDEKKSWGPLPDNVLKVYFDDIHEERRKISDGKYAHGISEETALKIVDFIRIHKDKDFYIRCHAGKSRSLAVGAFIMTLDWNRCYDTIPPNLKNNMSLNWYVFSKLVIANLKREELLYIKQKMESFVEHEKQS